MGLALMQYEYQLASAKATLYEREQSTLNDKEERLTKRIGTVTELFTKRQTAIENKYTKASTGVSNILTTARSASNGAGFVSALGATITGLSYTVIGLLGSYAPNASDIDSAASSSSTGSASGSGMTAANAMANVMSQLSSQIQTYMAEMLDKLKDLETEQLEETEEAQKGPLEEKDATMKAKINTLETLTTMADERAEKAKARLQKVLPNSMASYGSSS